MTEPFIGEIQIFGFNFAPRGWAMCNGTKLAIQQNTALFSLLGTTYGGDGRVTFALPNLTNRAVCSQGQGLGLTERSLGESFGENSVTLSSAQMPMHQHAVMLYAQPDTSKRASTPAPGNALSNPGTSSPFVAPGGGTAAFASSVVLPAGGSQPHENRQPYLAMNFCIALSGVYPSFG